MSLHVIGNKKCEICQIRFGTTSLINHYKVFHPELDFRVSDPVKNVKEKKFISFHLVSLTFKKIFPEMDGKEKERTETTTKT